MPNGFETPPTSPLTETHLKRIQDGLKRLDEAQKQIELAKRAGLDMSEQEREQVKTRDQLLRFKQVYFPGR